MRRKIHPLILLLLTETTTLILAESGKPSFFPSHVRPKYTQDEIGIIKKDGDDNAIEILESIDFSYQYSHESGGLVDEILEAINESIVTGNSNDHNEATHIIEVDMFSSKLKDKGITKFIDELCEQIFLNQNSQKKNVSLHLYMGMNDITCSGASRIFEKLVQMNNISISMKDTVSNMNNTIISDIDFDPSKNEVNLTKIDTENIKINFNEQQSNVTESTNQTLHTKFTAIQNENESSLKSENQTNETLSLTGDADSNEKQQYTIHIDSIDMTFNNFGQKKGSKIFNKSLRKLMESGVGCPQNLDFSRCCINAATCRSIAKVCNNMNRGSTNFEGNSSQNKIKILISALFHFQPS